MTIKDFRKNIEKKYTIINGHILYSEINENLKEVGLYNLSRFFDENLDFDILEESLKNREHNFYIPNEKYYAFCIDDNNIYKEHINSLYNKDTIKKYINNGHKENEFVALSKLKEYEMNYPNKVIWDDDLLNDKIDEETKKYLYDNKLIFKPKNGELE